MKQIISVLLCMFALTSHLCIASGNEACPEIKIEKYSYKSPAVCIKCKSGLSGVILHDNENGNDLQNDAFLFIAHGENLLNEHG